MAFNPMLAAEGVLGKIDYGNDGLIALPKLNGVRGTSQDGFLTARSLKRIPNDFTHNLYSGKQWSGVDGELVVGDFADENVFVNSTSGVMTKDGEPDVIWHAFDIFHPTFTYLDRLQLLWETLDRNVHLRIHQVGFQVVHDDEIMDAYAQKCLALGYEGLVLRDPNARYKEGRSTAKEQGFMRYCPWLRSEAIILKINEGEINTNESKVNELGYKRKSSHKAGKIPSGQAGTVSVRDVTTGKVFNIKVQGDQLQKEVWAHQDKFLGKILKYKFKPPVKVGGDPRFAQWEGIRHPLDMG